MSCAESGSASGPSPSPPGPWQRLQFFKKSSLPAATALTSPANGFFSSLAFGGSCHPFGFGASSCDARALTIAKLITYTVAIPRQRPHALRMLNDTVFPTMHDQPLAYM